MKASNEFVIGKHGIGYVGSYFRSQFGAAEFDPVTSPPKFQKLPRRMNDAAIESEIKPGYCTLGDVLAFIDNAPRECKDGWANLFYTPSCVVFVRWDGDEWSVGAWERGDVDWDDDNRVFSPATDRSSTLTPDPSDALTLESLAARVSALEQAVVRIVGKSKPKKGSSIKKTTKRK